MKETRPVFNSFRTVLIPLAAIAMVPHTALAQDGAAGSEHAEHAEHAGQEARIPFANHGGIRDWRAEGNDAIYFEDQHRQWYRAELLGPATGLTFVQDLAIKTNPDGSFDRWSAVYVDGQRLSFRSFVPVDGPPVHKVHERK